MCGIASIWGKPNETVVRDMMEAQRHRGPDDTGLQVLDKRGTLGHVRLSIMDPTSGQQPFRTEDGKLTLVANGMVYNHRNLWSQLIQQHEFRSTSDSETVLHTYEEMRESTPTQLDGAFAFLVADDNELFAARDPLGIKPLYLGKRRDSDELCFASELKALSRWSDDIQEFPAGNYYSSQTGFHPYYEVPQLTPEALPLETAVQRVRQTLETAVEKRLLSDVPLGAFLSGGLDSSIIAAMAIRITGQLKTFSVGVEGSPDLQAARRVARHIGSDHYEYAFTPAEIREALPEIIHHLESFDQDLVRSAIPCHFCSRLAADHVKVILTGEGADELFAGYTYFKSIQNPDTLHREMRRSIEGLHNVNLQRVDRMTMWHSIEGRVPFLDTALIELAQRIPVAYKLHMNSHGQQVEKWILRRAVEDLLPEDIVWRNKEQFDEGSGTVDIMNQVVTELSTNFDANHYRKSYVDTDLRSDEETLYHHLLTRSCDNVAPILANVGRWTGAE